MVLGCSEPPEGGTHNRRLYWDGIKPNGAAEDARRFFDRDFRLARSFPIILPPFREGVFQSRRICVGLDFDHPHVFDAGASFAYPAFLDAVFAVPDVVGKATGEFSL